MKKVIAKSALDVVLAQPVLQIVNSPQAQKLVEYGSYCGGFGFINPESAIAAQVASGTVPPIHMPFFFDAAILSRIRSPVTSRSN